MTVYVDKSRNRFGRMLMSHLVADTSDELHAMAARIGMKREWFQCPPAASMPHYDVSQTKRTLALKSGAVEIDRHGLVEVIRRLWVNAAIARNQ